MKSFTNLKSIDDIMYIVDGNKGGFGLGYKPYYMIGGMAIRDIENPDNLLYETEIQREFEEVKGDEPYEQEYETLRTVSLDDVLSTLSDDRLIYELSSLNDLMMQSKKEGINENDELYKNIVIDYNKILNEISNNRPNFKAIDKDEMFENQKKATQIVFDELNAKLKHADETKNIKEYKKLEKSSNMKYIQKAGKELYEKEFLEPELRKQELWDTLQALKKNFSRLKRENPDAKTAKFINEYKTVNPIMGEIFNVSDKRAAEIMTNWEDYDISEKEDFYNTHANTKLLSFDNFIKKPPKEQYNYLLRLIASKISGVYGESAITQKPILLTLIDKDTSKAKSSMEISAYNPVFINAIRDMGFDDTFIINNILKYSNFDIVKKNTVWELKSFYKDSYATIEGTQSYSNAKFFGGNTIITTPSGTNVKLNYKINKLKDGKVNFNVHIETGATKRIIQLLPHNKYKYYILEFNKDAIQYFDVGNQYNWDEYIVKNKEERSIKLPNEAFIKLPSSYAQLFNNIYDKEDPLKSWMKYKNTYPEVFDKPKEELKEEPKEDEWDVSDTIETSKKSGSKKKGKKKGKGMRGGTITNEIQVYNKIGKYIDNENTGKLRDLKNDIEHKIVEMAKNDDEDTIKDIIKYHDIIDERITPALSKMYLDKSRIIEQKQKGKTLKGTFDIIKQKRDDIIEQKGVVKEHKKNVLSIIEYIKTMKEVMNLAYDTPAYEESIEKQDNNSYALGDGVEALLMTSRFKILTETPIDGSELIDTKDINNPYYSKLFKDKIKPEFLYNKGIVKYNPLAFYPVDYLMEKTCWEIKNRSKFFYRNKHFEIETTKFGDSKNKDYYFLFEDKPLNESKKLNIVYLSGSYGNGYGSCFKNNLPRDYYVLIFFKDGIFIYDITKDIKIISTNKYLQTREVNFKIIKKSQNNTTKDYYKIPIYDDEGKLRDCIKPVSREQIELMLLL